MTNYRCIGRCVTFVLCVNLLSTVFAGGSRDVNIGSTFKNIIVTAPKAKKRDIAVSNRRFAGKELADYLKKITGETIPVRSKVSEEQIKQGGIIFVGESEYTNRLHLGTDSYDFGKGGFMIRVIDGNLYILGHDTSKGTSKIEGRIFGETGTYYGVCEFLERFAGVRWLWPGDLGTVIPKKKNIKVPAITAIYSKPAALFRGDGEPAEVYSYKLPDGKKKIDYNRPVNHNKEWWLYQRRQKAGKSFIPRTSHFMKTYLSDEDFKTHPEYFSFYNGKRQPHKERYQKAQLCTSNPNVVDHVVKKIIEQSKKYTKTELVDTAFSLSPNDGARFCMCAECKKLDIDSKPWPADVKGYGKIPGKVYNDKIGFASDLSNRIWGFVANVGKELNARDSDANVACYAYSCYEKPPSRITRLPSNVFVVICDYYYMIGNPEKYEEGRKHFLEWGKRASQLGFYMYYFSIAPRARRMAEFIRFTHNLGAKYYYAETNQTWGFMWIQYVLNRKGSWNPDLNVEEVILDYYQAAYGPGAPAMLKYLDLQEKVALQYNAYASFQNPEIITSNWTKNVRLKLREYLDEALKATENNPECHARVRFTEEAWEMLDSYCELAAILEKLKAMGIAIPYLDFKGQDKNTQNISPQNLNPLIEKAVVQWNRLENVLKSCEKKQGWSIPWYSIYIGANTREGRVIYSWGKTVADLKQQLDGKALPLPLLWAFKIDPEQKGKTEGWYKIDYNSDGWEKLRTDTHWEKQGYGTKKYPENSSDGYNGCAWYRTKIFIPDKQKGKKAWLKLGAVDESCTAWFNGKEIGSYDFFKANDPDGWLKAKRFEITNLIKYGENNSIAVMVSDKSGAGGIWKPCSIIFESQKKMKKISLKNSDFENEDTSPWIIKAIGKSEVNAISEPNSKKGKSLQAKVNAAKDSFATLNHPELAYTSLPIDEGQMYELQFKLKGKETKFFHRKKPISVRVIYYNGKRGKEAKYKYDWYRFRPTPQWQDYKIIVKSPDESIWKKASVSFFFNRQGIYQLDDFHLTEWK